MFIGNGGIIKPLLVMMFQCSNMSEVTFEMIGTSQSIVVVRRRGERRQGVSAEVVTILLHILPQ